MQSSAIVALAACGMCVTVSLFSIFVLGAEKPTHVLYLMEMFFSTVIFAMVGVFVEPLLRLLVVAIHYKTGTENEAMHKFLEKENVYFIPCKEGFDVALSLLDGVKNSVASANNEAVPVNNGVIPVSNEVVPFSTNDSQNFSNLSEIVPATSGESSPTFAEPKCAAPSDGCSAATTMSA